MIELRHVQKKFEDGMPLKDVNAVINDGDIISVIGPSGTGKSTLLRCINMIDPPTGGQILVDGVDITAPGHDVNKTRQKMGMVFQSFNLFGHLTVIENIMLAPMKLLGKSKQEAYDEGMRLLRTVGLGDKAAKFPDALSGGQKQRVAIARTLAMDPDVILLDEPTSALDPTMVREVEAVIKDLAESGKTLMIVTHEMRLARAICNRVFYMDQGGIYDDGTPEEIFDEPTKERTRIFIHQLKILEFTVDSKDYDFLGEGAAIDMYFSKNQIAPKMALKIRSAVEELVQQILLPHMEEPNVHVVIEYSEKDENAVVTVEYTGDKVDLEAEEHELSYAILKNAVTSITHEKTPENTYRVIMEQSIPAEK